MRIKHVIGIAFTCMVFIFSCQAQSSTESHAGKNKQEQKIKPRHLTKAEFLSKVANYEKTPDKWVETAHCLYGVPGSTEYATCRYFPYRQLFLLSAFRSTFFYQLGKTGRIPFSYRIRRRRGCPGDGRRTVFLLSYTHSLYTLGCEMPLRTADVSLSYGFKLLSEKN